MDGLLGSLCLAQILYFLFIGAPDKTLLLVLAAALVIFLSFNLKIQSRPARVFLGDSGSTVLGLIIAWCLIRYSQGETSLFSPVSALWILALPLLDAVCVLFGRPIRGLSAFQADRNHYHHRILEYCGGSVNLALLVILLVSAVGLAVAYIVSVGIVSEPVGFGSFLIVFIFWFIGFMNSKLSIPKA